MQSLEITNKQEFSVAIPGKVNAILQKHLLSKCESLQEEVAFALYKPSSGIRRFTGLIYKVLLPEPEERKLQGNVLIQSSYFRRVCRIAAQENSGVVLLHSHLGPGWQGMSFDDIRTELSYSENSLTLTGLPFMGLTLGTDGYWSARIWEYQNEWFERKAASTVRVVGERLSISYNASLVPVPRFKEAFKRTLTVWGPENHTKLARLRVGIVGLGSVGSIVAEMLSRMGLTDFVLIDFDEVQEHNLDRLMGATSRDIGSCKVHIAQRQIERSGTADNIQTKTVVSGITEEVGYLNGLDCDVLVSCVDRPWPRQVLNHIAYNHLIPVTDGGILVRLNPADQTFLGADWQVQTVGPERPCLQCLSVFESADVATEKAGLLEDPTYLKGLSEDHKFKRNENIFPFSANLASLEVFHLIEQITGIGGRDYFGVQRYDYNNGRIRINDKHVCDQDCLYLKGVGLGDTMFPAPIGIDHSANKARDRQK